MKEMTTQTSLQLSEDDVTASNLITSASVLKVPATTDNDATNEASQGEEPEEEEVEEEAFDQEETCDATDTLGTTEMGRESNQFAALLEEAQQQPQFTDDMARYLNQQQQQQPPQRMVPTPQQQAQIQQQFAQLQYQAAQQQAMAQQAAAASHQQQQAPLMMEMEDPEDSEDEGNGRSEKRAGRRKIRIEYIEDKSRRHITFSKRKAGIMKKAYELSTLTGTQVLLLVASETGHVYTFATPKLQPLITKPEGKNLIQACLNAPDVSDYGHQHTGYDDEVVDDRPVASNPASSNMAAISQNYAAAMAGLAGYQYPQQGTSSAATAAALAQAYMNQAAHYPAYAAQYNASAAAAGYWPQAGPASTQQSHDRASGQGESEAHAGQGDH